VGIKKIPTRGGMEQVATIFLHGLDDSSFATLAFQRKLKGETNRYPKKNVYYDRE